MKRRGYSLIEMIVVMSIGSLALATAAVSLGTLFQVGRRVEIDRASAASFARLARQFRLDAHSANSAESIAPAPQTPSQIHFIMADNRVIKWRREGPSLQRLVIAGDQIVHRDAFRLPPEADADWNIEKAAPSNQQPGAQLAVVRIAPRQDGAKDLNFSPVVIQAAVGLFARDDLLKDDSTSRATP